MPILVLAIRSQSKGEREGGRTFGVEAIHHPANDLELILEGKVDKVGIYQHAIGGLEGFVMS